VLGYLPLLTTLVAALFAPLLLARWRRRGGAHLAWWGLGVLCYGLGTALESVMTLRGTSVGLVKAWYAAGALLGAWPLAQGTVQLLFARRTALRLAWAVGPVVALAVVGVLLSPVDAARLQPHRPAADLLLWRAPRALAPWINGYAALVLVGGAALSALRFVRRRGDGARAAGNALIALGALLPGIGGAIARHGPVEPLYVTELLGLIAIAAGYALCVRGPLPQAQGPEPGSGAP